MRVNYRLPKWVAANVSNELYHLEDNKRMLEEMKLDIIESSPEPADGQPRGNGVGDPTHSKCVTEAIIKMIKEAKKMEYTFVEDTDYEWQYCHDRLQDTENEERECVGCKRKVKVFTTKEG